MGLRGCSVECRSKLQLWRGARDFVQDGRSSSAAFRGCLRNVEVDAVLHYSRSYQGTSKSRKMIHACSTTRIMSRG